MEITTTMFRFSVKKTCMTNKSDKAIQICESEADNALNEWVPLKKIDWVEDKSFPEFFDVIMPKWVFMKGNLPKFIKGAIEFIYRIEIGTDNLFNASYELKNIRN